MYRYVIQRTTLAVLTLWLISIAVFLLLRIAPGDPAVFQLGLNATPESIARVRAELNLDAPYFVQYASWLRRFVVFDYGTSVVSQTDVSDEFMRRLPVSLELMLLTTLWTVLFGVALGVVSAMKQNSAVDYIVRLLAVVGLAVPTFWVSTLVLIVPAQVWGYAPPLNQTANPLIAPLDNLRQFGPPSLVLALAAISGVMRLVRSEMLEVVRSDYVRTARAKGLKERTVVIRHALRNSMLPVITVLGLLVSQLVGGAVIIESIFNLDGLGSYIYRAVLAKDFIVVQSLVMFTAAVVIGMNLVVDVAYSALDPRIRYG